MHKFIISYDSKDRFRHFHCKSAYINGTLINIHKFPAIWATFFLLFLTHKKYLSIYITFNERFFYANSNTSESVFTPLSAIN